MAMLIKVQGTERDGEGNIVGICWRDSSGTKRKVSEEQAIKHLEEHLVVYFARVGGQQRNLMVRDGHLTTAIDSNEENRLDELPDWENI